VALLGRRLDVAVPDTLLEEKDSLHDKTAKLGSIARAFAIYGVDNVEIFRDTGGRSEGRLIRKVLEFLETPQYLRKRLFPLDQDLKFAGILPPLRIPSHRPKGDMASVGVGQVREGVANTDGTVDVGLPQGARLTEKVRAGTRLTVRMSSKDPLAAVPISRDQLTDYWGYSVEMKSIGEVLSDGRFDLKVATSRLGKPLSSELPRFRSALATARGVKLVFGAPSRGLFDMVGPTLPSRVGFVLNLFADQHTETVRTEEAVYAGLGLVNALSAEKGLSAE
jgi:methyltransferase